MGVRLCCETITFADPADQTFTANGTFDAPASSDSGLDVTLTSTTTGVCTVSGNTVTMVAPGTCSLTASQAGNDTYAAATDVSQDVKISVVSTIDLDTASDTGASNSDNDTEDSTPTFSGTGPANTLIELLANDVVVGSTTSDASGNWSITSSVLAPGTYNVATSIVGVVSAPIVVVIRAPAIAPTPIPALGFWALLGLSGLVGLMGFGARRKRLLS